MKCESTGNEQHTGAYVGNYMKANTIPQLVVDNIGLAGGDVLLNIPPNLEVDATSFMLLRLAHLASSETQCRLNAYVVSVPGSK